MIVEALHHAHHITVAGILFRNFRHGSMSITALKRLYADNGLLQDEHSDLELVKVDTLEEMEVLLSGSTHIVCGQYELNKPSEGAKGDLTV